MLPTTAIPAESASLIEASSFLIERGYCGLVWLDEELIVREHLGALVAFVENGRPMSDSIVALYGCEPDILSLRDGSNRRIELSGIRIIAQAGEGLRLNFYMHWLAISRRFLLIVLRTTTQDELETELENQSRRRALAEAKVVEQRNQLEAANAELTRANRELSEYANIIAHDLKSPLRAMRYLAEDIETALGADDRAAAFERLADLQDQSRRMSRMLSDLLTYATIGHAEEEDAQPTDTRALVEAVVASLPRPRGFTIEVEGLWPVLETASPALDIVLRNLIDNAIKHHDRPDGRVVITATPTRDGAVFEVTDDGPGIPARFQEVVFLPFRRLDSPRAQAWEGSGIGLSLVRKTAETAGGKLELTSDPAARRGTTFTLTWPGRIAAEPFGPD